MKTPVLLIIFASLYSFAQSQSFKGTILDESNRPMIEATVIGMLEDSSMIEFTSSDQFGKFVLINTRIKLIQINYLGYLPLWIEIKEQEFSKSESKILKMAIHATELEAIKIEAKHNRLLLHGDTINYNTEHLAVKPGDVVEDILDQLPGVEVQPDGSIKAFGEKVENVLVDGHEFFGKDTKMATKNLAAEAVDKVQVFDKSSEYSEFTGVDDGQDEKTINLKLKDDFKNGHFGQVKVGAADQGIFAGRGNINQFGKSHRTSLISLANNRNEPGFTMQQYFEFLGGLESFMSEGGRVEIDLNDQVGLPIGDNNEPGIHTRNTTGINYKGIWSKRLEAQMHYLFNFDKNDLKEQRLQQSLIQEGVLTSSDTTQLNLRSNFHNLNSKLTFIPSKYQKLTWSINASWGHENLRISGREKSEVTNSMNNLMVHLDEHQRGHSQIIVSTLQFNQRFKNQVSLLARINASRHTKSQSMDQSILSQFSLINYDSSSFVRQDHFLKNKTFDSQINLVYPINKYWSTDISSFFHDVEDNHYKPWYEGLSNPSELQIKEHLSGDVNRSIYKLTPGWKLRFKNRLINVSMNLKYSWQGLNSTFREKQFNSENKYHTWLPSMFSRWDIGQSQSLNLTFFTDLIQPTATQLQPTRNQIDPLNIYQGNPALIAMKSHDLGLSYFYYDQFNDATTYARITAGKVDNQINHRISTDSLFRLIHQPINTKFMQNYSFSGEHSRPLGWGNINIKFKSQMRYSSGIAKIEADENTVNKIYWRASLGVGHRKVHHWKWGLTYTLSNQNVKYSINQNFNREYGTSKANAFLEYIPNDWWSFKMNNEWQSLESPLVAKNTQILISNLSLTRYFTPERQFRVSIHAYDILDHNTGINRLSEGNAIVDHRYNAIGRHFMLTIGYSIRGHKKEDTNAINIKVGGS